MDKVYLAKVSDYSDISLQKHIENIFASFDLLIALNEKSRVLLKPNLVTKATPDKAVTTHPELVRLVIKELKRHNVQAKNIILADSCGGAAGTNIMKSVYKASGMAQLCIQEDISLYTGTGSIIRKNENGKLVREFTLIDVCDSIDLLINLPKLKTHVMSGLSAAVKNVYGTIPGLMKAELHMRFPQKESFGDMLVDLNLALGKTVSIIDGILAMQGDGPSGGTTYPAGLVVASQNQYLADLVCCTLVDIPPERVPYLLAASKRGIAPLHYSTEQILCGKEHLLALPNFEKPKSYLGFDFGAKYPVGLCWATPLVTKLVSPHPAIKKSKCIGCGKCAEICPQKIITVTKKKAKIGKDNCIKCFCCHEMCPAKAIDVKRIKIFDFKF